MSLTSTPDGEHGAVVPGDRVFSRCTASTGGRTHCSEDNDQACRGQPGSPMGTCGTQCSADEAAILGIHGRIARPWLAPGPRAHSLRSGRSRLRK